MLTKRIIPCLDIMNNQVVKGINFLNLQEIGDPVELAKYYNNTGADELIFLDITASKERRKTITKLAARVSKEIFIPFTVGGGISSIDEMEEILNSGADKVSLNTAAVQNPKLISEGRFFFGSQAVVLAIDAKRTSSESWSVFIMGGSQSTGMDVVEWAKTGEKLGAGEILLTSIDRDGTKKGFDIELTKTVSEAVNIPVIASGGGGAPDDFVGIFTKGKSDAALAASIFHSKTYTCDKLKEYLLNKNINVRRCCD